MMEINGKWFYKSPEAKTIDFMPAFFEKPLDGAADLTLKIFAPPASGENDPSQGADWQTNYYTTITKLPNIRIRFARGLIGITHRFTAIRDTGSEIKQGRYSAPAFVCRRF